MTPIASATLNLTNALVLKRVSYYAFQKRRGPGRTETHRFEEVAANLREKAHSPLGS
jgi:hypothetical protein